MQINLEMLKNFKIFLIIIKLENLFSFILYLHLTINYKHLLDK